MFRFIHDAMIVFSRATKKTRRCASARFAIKMIDFGECVATKRQHEGTEMTHQSAELSPNNESLLICLCSTITQNPIKIQFILKFFARSFDRSAEVML